MDESQFITVQEVAKHLGMKPLAIYRKVKRRRIPSESRKINSIQEGGV